MRSSLMHRCAPTAPSPAARPTAVPGDVPAVPDPFIPARFLAWATTARAWATGCGHRIRATNAEVPVKAPGPTAVAAPDVALWVEQGAVELSRPAEGIRDRFAIAST